ncbi:helix-turn-helix domain-containing protein [Methylorubrum subtropicum]
MHLSRVLREMRRTGLIHLSGGTLTILNRAELERLSGFEAGYLEAI